MAAGRLKPMMPRWLETSTRWRRVRRRYCAAQSVWTPVSSVTTASAGRRSPRRSRKSRGCTVPPVAGRLGLARRGGARRRRARRRASASTGARRAGADAGAQAVADGAERADQRAVAVVLVGQEAELGLALDQRAVLHVGLLGQERLDGVDADGEDDVGPPQDALGRLEGRKAEDPEHAEGVGVGLVDDALAVERGDDRRAEPLGELLDGRAAADGAAADDDERQLEALELGRHDVERRVGRRHQRQRPRQERRVDAEGAGGGDAGGQHVGGEREVDGALLLAGAADEVAQERRELAGVDAVGAAGRGPSRRGAPGRCPGTPSARPARSARGR